MFGYMRKYDMLRVLFEALRSMRRVARERGDAQSRICSYRPLFAVHVRRDSASGVRGVHVGGRNRHNHDAQDRDTQTRAIYDLGTGSETAMQQRSSTHLN